MVPMARLNPRLCGGTTTVNVRGFSLPTTHAPHRGTEILVGISFTRALRFDGFSPFMYESNVTCCDDVSKGRTSLISRSLILAALSAPIFRAAFIAGAYFS